MQSFEYPFNYDDRKRTASARGEAVIRQMIEQVLFTSPGERVMRPTFGSGLLQLTFEPNSDQLAATTQALVQGALQEWLADWIVVNDVQVFSNDSKLSVQCRFGLSV